MLSLSAIQNRIEKDAKLPGGQRHFEFASTVTGEVKKVKQALDISKADVAPKSETVTVGKSPDGFGQGFVWGREDNQALLAVYLSASDLLGVSIEGLQAGDRIVVTSATGLASFAEDDKITERGIIGLIASGASLGAGIAGFPGAVPFIKAAEDFAKNEYRPKDVSTKSMFYPDVVYRE